MTYRQLVLRAGVPLLAAVVFITGCQDADGDSGEAAAEEAADVTEEGADNNGEGADLEETIQALQGGGRDEAYILNAEELHGELDEVFLLDTRAAHDYEEYYIDGTVNIPAAELEEKLDELPEDEKIVIVCYAGKSSVQSSAMLRDNGFDAHMLDGGMAEWVEAEYETVGEPPVEEEEFEE